MINAIVGRPGGGKSYEAVKFHIMTALLDDKRKVVTNIPFNVDYFCAIHGEEYRELVVVLDGQFSAFGEVRPFSHEQDYLQYDDWKNDKGQGVLFCVDEAHLSLGQRCKPSVLEYLSMHRHYGHDLLLLTQNQRKLNRDVRDMVEVAYRCSKMSAFGQSKAYNRKTFHGLESTSNPVHQETREYDANIFKYYQSHTASNSAITEADAKGTVAKLNPYKTITTVFFVIGFGGLGFILLNAFWGDDDKPTPVVKTVKKATQEIDTNAQSKLSSTEQTTVQAALPKQAPILQKELSRTERIEKKLKDQSAKYHPFNKVTLHVNGIYEDYATREKIIYFKASQNGQAVFDVTLKDLALAGYSVEVLSECVVRVTYYDYSEYITCDSPRIGAEHMLTKVND